MSGAKAKGGGEAVAEGTPVRVLYDSTVWYHGEVRKVLGHGADGSTKCLVWFEDGQEVEEDVPSKEAQVRGSARPTHLPARLFARPPVRPPGHRCSMPWGVPDKARRRCSSPRACWSRRCGTPGRAGSSRPSAQS